MTANHPSRLKIFIVFFIAIIAISYSAILVKQTNAPSAIAATYRMLFTVVILLPLFIKKHRSELKLLRKKEVFYSILSGVFLAFHFLSWFESLKHTSIASSVVLVSLQPVFAVIEGVTFYKERYSIISLLGMFVAILGSAVIGWGDFKLGGTALYGDFLSMVAAFMVTIYWLFGQTIRRSVSLITYTILVYSSSAVTLLVYDLVFQYSLANYPIHDWMIFLGLAIIPNIFGHTALNWAVKYVNATTISMVTLGEPIGASIFAFYIFSETLTINQWLGGALILGGLFIYNKYYQQKANK